MMAKNKTTETHNSVADFINGLDVQKQRDSIQLIEIFKSKTGFDPKMWGPSIIGFGSYHYKYASGHEGDAPLAGFSPRKDAISLYFWPEFKERQPLLEMLGKHKSGKSCIYIKKLTDADLETLGKLIVASVEEVKKTYPQSSVK